MPGAPSRYLLLGVAPQTSPNLNVLLSRGWQLTQQSSSLDGGGDLEKTKRGPKKDRGDEAHGGAQGSDRVAKARMGDGSAVTGGVGGLIIELNFRRHFPLEKNLEVKNRLVMGTRKGG